MDYERSPAPNKRMDRDAVLKICKDSQKQNDKLARMLCTVMQGLPPHEVAIIVSQNEEIADWWSKHKFADAAARKKQKQAAEKERLKKAALAKLTEEEKELFGLKKTLIKR